MPCSSSPVVGCAIPACIAGDIPACLAAGLQGGVYSWGEGVSAPGGVWSRGCLLPGVGCLLPGVGCLLPGGCLLLGGVSAPRWVSASGGVCSQGVSSPGGVSAQGGVAGEIEGDQVQAHIQGGN